MKTITRIAIAAIPLVLAASTAGAETFVRMVSGPSGGSWYPYGAKMAEMWGKEIKGITTSNGPGGGVGNVRDVGRGDAQVGWTFGNTAYDGYNGKAKFKKPLKNVRFFANLYPGILQTAVPAKSNIRSYKDLKGKNFSPGKLTFSGNIAVQNLLKLYGVSYDDIKNAGGTIHRVGYKDSVALMKDGHIDAFVGLTTAPNSSFIDLAFSPGIRFLGVEAGIADKYVKTYPGFIKTTLRKGTYEGVSEDVLTIASPTVLIVNKSMSSDVAYNLAKVLWEKHGELVKVNKYWNNVSLKEAVNGAAIPVHPGALKYYREKGVAK